MSAPSSYARLPWKRVMMGDSQYVLQAEPTQPYWSFDHWLKFKATNSFAPDSLTDNVIFSLKDKDSVVAVFRYFNPDSVIVTFTVDTPGNGIVEFEGTPLPSYPYSVKLDRRFTYKLNAIPAQNRVFDFWSKRHDSTVISPAISAERISFTYRSEDTITAHFSWPLPPPPTVPQIPLDLTMMVPTAFSPNGDGLNDFFGVLGSKDLRNIDLKVFNRWGEMVFASRSPQVKWDGTYNGLPCEQGVYFYSLSVEWNNHQRHKNATTKGEVTLVR